ncbi:hypothetical protein FR483_n587R [Paramecium bursaria Chlorella virus FR483]|uniref:Uncharacterized protein n587R n=1 Tax=Paramecium bursaria Chlorella virus FR483 TaxID=399781 RepID=A7J7U1_PBCVF|nr:hypothetical protein FR483_n587R [Paramecium bursaria Chlorella virus FR483]ABT15872.1 hypothetical protein FR483_n587R [Paramecium bursaria Chlorella virus FR483]
MHFYQQWIHWYPQDTDRYHCLVCARQTEKSLPSHQTAIRQYRLPGKIPETCRHGSHVLATRMVSPVLQHARRIHHLDTAACHPLEQ